MSKELPESALEPRLREVWQRTQRKHISSGFLALFRWGVPLFLLGMLIDWLTFMPTFGRVILLTIIVGIALYKACQHGWKNLRAFDAARTALQVEEQHGGLESLLVTAVQFRESKTSSPLIETTCKKAENTVGDLKPTKIVNFKSLKTPIYIASAFAAVVLVFAMINGPFLAAGLARIFTPWTNIAYPTKTKLTLSQEDLVVKEGDSAKITIDLSGEVPTTAKFYLRTDDGDPREIELDVTDGSSEYTIASASRDFSYRVKAGDARSDWQQVKVIPAPRIENVQVKLEYPSYLEKETKTVEALTLTVPQQTKIHWKITLDRPIREAVLNRDGKDPLPLEITNDGRQVVIEEEINASRGYSFSWVEKENGFDFTSPRYFLQVASDQAPRVELTKPESNLIAMIGRPLSLAVRAQDDHGIGSTTVAYRVNQREEKTVALKLPTQTAQGEQPIDWDYRKTLTDLKIGDTVSFTIEVKDRYPGENGPHIVRSDTRKITFLSEKAYLKQIQKKRDRLLSRILTIYRQQRSAFENVRTLDPEADTYMQTCQVEAIRQELVRDQLTEISSQVKSLIDDLAANNVSDAPEGNALEQVRTALLDISEKHLTNAASLLRHQSSVAAGDKQEVPNPTAAAGAVNTAARELGSLVLLRSIEIAQEVYARETRMLAQVQASLRWRNTQVTSAEEKTALSKDQDELAQWTKRLITDLQNGMRYEKRPLAVLRLVQSVKDLQVAKTEQRMRQTAQFIIQGKPDQAELLQAGLITTLLDAEFSIRLSGAYTTLIKTRNQIRLLSKVQTILREQCADMSTDAFKAGLAQATQDQEDLRERLLTLLLPTVPAPHTQLFDETFPQVPPVQSLLKVADLAMAESLTNLTTGQQKETIANQLKAEQALINLAKLVDQWSVELGIQTLGLSTLVADSSERLSRIEDYEAKVIGLLEKTDAAAANEQKIDTLVEAQSLLTAEIATFKNDLTKKTDQDAPPLQSRIERVEKAMRDAVTSLKANDADQALANQEQAADILAEAFVIVTRQNEQLGLLQSLMMFQRSVRFANGYMSDIVAEQWDMIAATKALKTEDATALLPKFTHLRRCMTDVAPLLDLVAQRVDVGTPLAFSASDLADAVDSLENDDKLDAIDAQDAAAESLAKVTTLITKVKDQTGYIAEIIEFLHASVADTATSEYQQNELKLKTQSAKPDQINALAAEQLKLLTKAEKDGLLIVSVTGMQTYSEPAKLMRQAATLLEANDAPAAIEQMELAGEALKANTESLFAVISMLHGLPNIEILTFADPRVQRLVDVLAVASAHKVLFRNTNNAELKDIKAMAAQQTELAAKCQELSLVGEPHPMLQNATSQLTEAATAMKSADKAAIKNSQKVAMQTLRHFIIEQALILETAVPPSSAQDADPAADGAGSDGESAFSAGFISDFVSGEAPKDKQAGWNVRADRNRAALNQNFARELPLEYRGLLKNYYERVAK